METEVRFYFSNKSKNKLIAKLKELDNLEYKGRFYECTDQYNHPMKEYDFYSKEIDGRFRLRKTVNDDYEKCMITWKRRLKTNVKELIHQEEEIEVEISSKDYDNLRSLLKNVLHLELVESYERYRSVFSNNDIEIVLDEYPFGLCLEIENKGSEENAISVIKEWLNKLGLDLNNAYRLSWDDKYSELCKEQNIKVNNIVRFNEEMPTITNLY